MGAAPADSVSCGTSENGNVIDEEADYTLIAGGWPIPSEYDPYAENMPCLPGSFKMDGARDKAFWPPTLILPPRSPAMGCRSCETRRWSG